MNQKYHFCSWVEEFHLLQNGGTIIGNCNISFARLDL